MLSHVISMATGAALVLSVAASPIATAQTTGPGTPGAGVTRPGDPQSTIPEKIDPAPSDRENNSTPGASTGTGAGTGETLSDQLGRTGGVIPPPQTAAPSMNVTPPVPDPNTTRVIPPPGSPGNPSPVIPK